MKTSICPMCHNEFILGVNGIYIDSADEYDTMIGCDECLGIERDADGYPWLPTDECKIMIDVKTEEHIYITREQALRGNKYG